MNGGCGGGGGCGAGGGGGGGGGGGDGGPGGGPRGNADSPLDMLPLLVFFAGAISTIISHIWMIMAISLVFALASPIIMPPLKTRITSVQKHFSRPARRAASRTPTKEKR